MTNDQILDVLRTIKYPGYSRDIVSFGLVKAITTSGTGPVIQMQLASGNAQIVQQIQTESDKALKAAGINNATVQIQLTAAPAASATGQQSKPSGIRRIVAVASGKGGVGKSTASVNLACGLRHLGAKVGLLDCDIYGPSIPLMMGINEKPTLSNDERMIPPQKHGIKLMSMGFLLDGDTPVIWRGPMIMKTIQQFLLVVDWGELDYLLVDLPPGTGDAQLSLCQTVPLDGGVIVTTPQEASLGVVRKGIAMFEKVNVPILGIIENMSYFTTPNGERVEIFGNGGGRKECERTGIPFLGEIPLFTAIREGGDSGVPVTLSDPDGTAGQCFIRISEYLRQKLG